MSEFNLQKLTAVPSTPTTPNTFFFVSGASTPDYVELYVSSKDGTQLKRLLDKSKLQGLQAQIAKAKEQMQDFSDAAKQTMQDLDSEFATLQGREMDALRMKQAQRLADLQAKMAEATVRGNGEEIAHYSKAISLQKQINAEQTRQGVQKALQERQPIVSAETKSIQSISAADVVSGFNARIEQAKQEAKEEGRQEFARELLDNVKRRAR